MDLQGLQAQLITLRGSTFTGLLNMDGLAVRRGLFMDDGEFADVRLIASNIKGNFTMNGAQFKVLNMHGAHVGNGVYMRQGATFTDVIMLDVKVSGPIDMTSSKFERRLDMERLQVEGGLFLRNSSFGRVRLSGAKLEGDLDVSGATVTGALKTDGMTVGGNLLMHKGRFHNVRLRDVTVRQAVSIVGSTFTGQLNMEGLEVVGDLFMRNSNFVNVTRHSILFARIGGNLEVSGSSLGVIDLTGARVRGELRLASERHVPPKWQEGSRLILRNTEVGQIQDLPDAWPDSLELDGFTYSQLGGFGAKDQDHMGSRDIAWLVNWLSRDRYSPQPYAQLAHVLERSGYWHKANEIRYASKEMERAHSATWTGWLWLTAQWIFTGYGYRFARTFLWSVTLIFIGWIVLWVSGERKTHHFGFWYSVDRLLPVVELRKTHYDTDLDCPLTRGYFYFHVIMGYILVTFLAIALSGLVSK